MALDLTHLEFALVIIVSIWLILQQVILLLPIKSIEKVTHATTDKCFHTFIELGRSNTYIFICAAVERVFSLYFLFSLDLMRMDSHSMRKQRSLRTLPSLPCVCVFEKERGRLFARCPSRGGSLCAMRENHQVVRTERVESRNRAVVLC